MPKVQWTGLPPALRDHLFERLRERKITAEDLYQLKAWRESEPEAPDGPWYKDFGSFKICGEGEYPNVPQSSLTSRRWWKLTRREAGGAGLVDARYFLPRFRCPIDFTPSTGLERIQPRSTRRHAAARWPVFT